MAERGRRGPKIISNYGYKDGSGEVDAIASGRKAAVAIDLYLKGSGDIDESLYGRTGPNPRMGKDEGFADWHRLMAPCLLPETRDFLF